jgi:6-phosphogluconolactonase
VYRFHPKDGSLVLLNIHGGPMKGAAPPLVNPAFSRHHPRLNVVYTCTEDIDQNGQIFCYSLAPDGTLSQLGSPVDAGGTSTCYLTISRDQKHLLAVNYWNSTLAVVPICTQTGALTGPVKALYDPKGGKDIIAAGRCKGGVNHSHNDERLVSFVLHIWLSEVNDVWPHQTPSSFCLAALFECVKLIRIHML